MGKVVFEVKTIEYSGLVMNFFFRPIFIAQPQTLNQEKKFNQKLNEPYFKTEWVPRLIKSAILVLSVWLVSSRLRNLIVYSSFFYTPDPEFVENTVLYVFNTANQPVRFGTLYSPSVNYFLTKGCIHFDLFDLSTI